MFVYKNMDCLEGMKEFSDKYFDLAIVDPPYGIKQITGRDLIHGGGKLKNRVLSKNASKIKKWDYKPSEEYFNELFRISKNQIIWGGNYFNLPPYRCVIVWDKYQPFENFSAVEIAWSSFNKPAKIFKFDNRYAGKIHPTQKPIELYKWLLNNFAKKGDKILDTHVGSGSSIIACLDMGFDVWGFEIDKEYYEASMKRINEFLSQLKIF